MLWIRHNNINKALLIRIILIFNRILQTIILISIITLAKTGIKINKILLLTLQTFSEILSNFLKYSTNKISDKIINNSHVQIIRIKLNLISQIISSITKVFNKITFIIIIIIPNSSNRCKTIRKINSKITSNKIHKDKNPVIPIN